jgi:carbon-monoxide dehydrogenase iron sulfur subunit
MQVNDMKRVYPKEEYCMGCSLCLVACVVEHSQSKDILLAYKKENPRPGERNVVEEGLEGDCFSLQCRHCEMPDCVDACINGALYIDEGVIKVNKEHCVACWMCIMACPYGCIYKEKNATGWNSNKCDLCPDREIPSCVAICPNRALVYEER